jgi:hypothetical protein
MQEITSEQQEHANIQAQAFISDPRHVRFIESDANNAVLIEAIGAAGFEWNAENLHRVFTENLNRLELKPEPNAQPVGPIREEDTLRVRQAEQRLANDALLASEEQAKLKLTEETDPAVDCSLAAQQARRRQQTVAQFRNGRLVETSANLPTNTNRQGLAQIAQRVAAQQREDAQLLKRRHA